MTFKKRKPIAGIDKMPPLAHSAPGGFDIMASDVVDWLVSQPTVRQKIFDLARSSNLIAFDQVSRKWQGKNYNAADDSAERYSFE